MKREVINLKRSILSLVIILLFIFSAIVPMTFGYKNKISNNRIIQSSSSINKLLTNHQLNIDEPNYDINSNKKGFLFVKLKSMPYKLVNKPNGETEIIMEDFGNILIPGYPMLPSKTFYIGIPPGSEVFSIEIINGNFEMIPGNHKIVSAPPFVNDINLFNNSKNEEIYSSLYQFPSTICEYLGMGQIRKYSFAQIKFSPICYYPASEKLMIYSEINIKIEYKIKRELSNELLADSVMDELASKIIFNFKSIYPYYNLSQQFYPIETYDFLIITTGLLENSTNIFKKWKEKLGYSVKIVNISWISSHYDGWDLVEKIRNFLIDKYSLWGIEYVLIIGSFSTIPMRYCYPNKNNHNDDGKIPTDYYYADLTGNWDSDDDRYYGERGDDSPDFNPDVWVGRIPVDTTCIVENICNKTINFKRDNSSWKKNVLSCSPFICFENENYTGWPRTDHATVTEEIWNDIYSQNGYQRTTMYEKAGIDISNYPCNYGLSRDNVTTYWSDGYGIVNLDGHGNRLAVYRKLWDFDDGNGVPDPNEISWDGYFFSCDNITLNDNKPSIIFSIGCGTAFPEKSNNLGKSLLVNGSIAYIGATRSSYLRAGWENESYGGCQSIEYYFFDYLINQNYTCAEALYYSKIYYKNYFDFGGWSIYQNLYDFCLYGDPTVSVITYQNKPPNKPVIFGPSNGKTDISYNFSINSTDPEEDDISKYIIDWGDGTGEKFILGPFLSGEEIFTNYKWSSEGTYKIQLKAIDIYKAESDICEFYITITKKSKETSTSPYLRFLERYPLVNRLLTFTVMI